MVTKFASSSSCNLQDLGSKATQLLPVANFLRMPQTHNTLFYITYRVFEQTNQ